MTHIAAQVSFNGMNQRNEDSVKKTAAGMLKLLFPHLVPGEVPREIMDSILLFSVEMRKRIVDQMAAMKPAEFRDASFDCTVK